MESGKSMGFRNCCTVGLMHSNRASHDHWQYQVGWHHEHRGPHKAVSSTWVHTDISGRYSLLSAFQASRTNFPIQYAKSWTGISSSRVVTAEWDTSKSLLLLRRIAYGRCKPRKSHPANTCSTVQLACSTTLNFKSRRHITALKHLKHARKASYGFIN